MRYFSNAWVFVVGLTYFGEASIAQELSFNATLTTDYVFRGVSVSDENPAVQLGIDVDTASGIYFGAWASTADIATQTRRRDTEVDYYLGYAHTIDNNWNVAVAFSRYTYPGSTGNINYNYNEASIVAGYRDTFWLEFDYTNSLFGHDAAAQNVEVLMVQPWLSDYSVSLGLGYFDVSEFADSGYWHWQAGASRSWGPVTLDLRYFDTSRSVVGVVSSDSDTDARLVFSLSAAF